MSFLTSNSTAKAPISAGKVGLHSGLFINSSSLACGVTEVVISTCDPSKPRTASKNLCLTTTSTSPEFLASTLSNISVPVSSSSRASTTTPSSNITGISGSTLLTNSLNLSINTLFSVIPDGSLSNLS